MDKKFKISKVDALIYISTFACFKIDILSYASKGFTFFYLLLELFCAIYFTLKREHPKVCVNLQTDVR